MFSLLEYITTHANRPELTAGLAGGFHESLAPQNTPKPYCVLESLTDSPDYATGTDTIGNPLARFTFYCDRYADIRSAVTAYKREFVNVTVPIGDGKIFGATIANEWKDYEPADQTGLSAKKYMIEIQFLLDIP